jgi:hypothetical protein
MDANIRLVRLCFEGLKEWQVQLTCKECPDGIPRLAHVLRSGKYDDLESCVESIDAMVKKFAERAALVGSSPVSLTRKLVWALMPSALRNRRPPSRPDGNAQVS